MTIKHMTLYLTLMLFLTFCSSCANMPILEGNGESAANAEKTLVPHQSWTCGMQDGIPKPENGILVLEAQINLDKVYELGKTPYGRRQVLVIKDGTITSDKIQASVLPGGLEFKLKLSNGIIEIEQVLVFQTNDNKYIYMRNAGTGLNENDVRVVMDFEAPNNSSAAWLNTGQYIARRTVDLTAGILKMTVYDVSEVTVNASDVIKISKPTDAPYQPWDYRKASPSEQPGEQFITETVALGRSTSVGLSKRGMRNIIPITGGTLSGNITGKVLFGGADYQNFTNGPAIDARYLWQTDSGEIIIVRNTGPMSSLVPTFETRVDGEYSWLNSGTYLSSNPGMGAGGVSLTMYKSK
jgi:hypothetical protein